MPFKDNEKRKQYMRDYQRRNYALAKEAKRIAKIAKESLEQSNKTIKGV
jgi:hypothetical protein